jgi:hypothetical protein
MFILLSICLLVVILQTLENYLWVLHPGFAIYYIFITHQACDVTKLLRPANTFLVICLSGYYQYRIYIGYLPLLVDLKHYMASEKKHYLAFMLMLCARSVHLPLITL